MISSASISCSLLHSPLPLPLRGHLSVKQQVREKLKRRAKQNQEGIPQLDFTVLV